MMMMMIMSIIYLFNYRYVLVTSIPKHHQDPKTQGTEMGDFGYKEGNWTRLDVETLSK